MPNFAAHDWFDSPNLQDIFLNSLHQHKLAPNDTPVAVTPQAKICPVLRTIQGVLITPDEVRRRQPVLLPQLQGRGVSAWCPD